MMDQFRQFREFRIECPRRLGGGSLVFSVPWYAMTEQEFKSMMATAVGVPDLTPEEKEAKRKQDAAEWAAKKIEDEKRTFDRAEKIPYSHEIDQQYDCFYSESHPWNDGYFDEPAEFFEAMEEMDPEDRPNYFWTCKPVKLHKFTADNFAEDFEDLYEDAADRIDPQSLIDLQAAIDRFYQANKSIKGYSPNYDIAIVLPEVGYKRHEP